eukprot:1160569-Pelagomonas_calceolata.AAC.7
MQIRKTFGQGAQVRWPRVQLSDQWELRFPQLLSSESKQPETQAALDNVFLTIHLSHQGPNGSLPSLGLGGGLSQNVAARLRGQAALLLENFVYSFYYFIVGVLGTSKMKLRCCKEGLEAPPEVAGCVKEVRNTQRFTLMTGNAA